MFGFLGSTAGGLELTLMGCALGGTLFYLLRLALMMLGGVWEDFAGPSDDPHAGAVTGHESESAFQIISLNTIAAFVMMFGWAGLTAHVQFQLAPTLSIVIATVIGAGTMVLTAYMYLLARKLQSGGAHYSIHDCVGRVASVYQQIPVDGRGQIQLTVNGLLREIDARSTAGEAIPSFAAVIVDRVIDETTVAVSQSFSN